MSNVNELTNAGFEEKIEKSTGYALVDFWAPWCGPCRMMSPVIDEISDEIKNVSFYKVNVDENTLMYLIECSRSRYARSNK